MAQQALGDTLRDARLLGSLDACASAGSSWRVSCALTAPLGAGGGGNTRRITAPKRSALPQAPCHIFRQKGL